MVCGEDRNIESSAIADMLLIPLRQAIFGLFLNYANTVSESLQQQRGLGPS
jgi:hypothetical protein